LSNDQRQTIRQLETASVVLLVRLLWRAGCGNVHLVSNGSTDWVIKCCRIFFPTLAKMIKTSIVKFTSARDLYQRESPKNPTMWKQSAFQDIMSHLLDDAINKHSAMSIGDSDQERDALRITLEGMSMWTSKTIKLQPRLCPPDMLKQLVSVLHIVGPVLDHCGPVHGDMSSPIKF
jgi:transcription elongation factor GreA-like protein